ncbi:MAG: hypothetical protein ACJA0B_001418 [Alcanivorax borkumensis]|jgi:hypothetical protein
MGCYSPRKPQRYNGGIAPVLAEGKSKSLSGIG